MNPPRNPIFGRGVEPDRPTKQAIDRISGRVLARFHTGSRTHENALGITPSNLV
jgi:hypothetical protein